MAASFTDITKPVDLLQPTKSAGHQRTQRPLYMDFMPPCNSACPAGENIQAWLSYAQAGDYETAFQKIMEDNPFPSVMGRVCVKPCETGCNRNHVDETINIHAIERFIGDKAIEESWMPKFDAKPTGKRVMVVGAGPSGLSAAYHLARLGHTVEIFEAAGTPGGLVETGVPDYRLPKPILYAEIDRIVRMGVQLHVNYEVKDLLEEKTKGGFDAVYLAIGAYAGKQAAIGGTSNIPVLQALDFLSKFRLNALPELGKKVVIYGGGKLAMYLSRVVKRLGHEPVVLYFGDRKLMPAYDFEADDAIAEGVEVQFLRNIKSIDGNQFTIECMKMEKGKPVATGEELVLEADSLIMALGQEINNTLYNSIEGIESKADGGIVINTERMSGYAGIFAGGDMLPGELRSTTIAIGHGKKAAKYIDAYLNVVAFQKPPKPKTAGYQRLHMWFKTDAPQQEQTKLAPEVAVKSFEEVVHGISEAEALYEAKRCLSCGNCFECDGCFGACPEDAIIKLGKGNRYKFNYDACTGCAVCYEQCPCHAIEMIPEPVNSDNNGQ
ncbi:MAG TPA: NAD(P)-binding protein [Phnomibacter sp.]|nr:NAD(P)-binding protein [Phnomibacter sp.]